MIRISEIFHSIQGEGKLTGTPSVFVRTSGCNLRCWFCDTPYASWNPEGDSFTVDSILSRIRAYRCNHVVITGGEPTLFEDVGDLIESLRTLEIHTTVETAGTIERDWDCSLWSISPKLCNSSPIGLASEEWVKNHETRRKTPEIVERLIAGTDYQLKFVVGSVLDAEEVLEYLGSVQGWKSESVMLMPRGTSTEELQQHSSWLPNWCQKHNLRYCDRQHIYWFGNKRGT